MGCVVVMLFLPLGIPCDVDKYFCNRENELVTFCSVVDMLRLNVSTHILVTGYSGVGKSFFIKKFINDLPPDILGVYIDVSHIYGIQKGELREEQIMHFLLGKMDNVLEENLNVLSRFFNRFKRVLRNIKIHSYDFSGENRILGIMIPSIMDNYMKLCNCVMAYPQRVVDSSNGKIKGFVIVLDEFQLLSELKSPKAFFQMFRSFTQEQNNVTYIFTGSTSATMDIIAKLNYNDVVFGNKMIQLNINPFTKNETIIYLKEKVSEIKFTKSGLEQFYEYTQGYPLYINTFCNILSPNISYDNNEIIKKFHQKIDQIAFKWIYIWPTFSRQEKQIITTLIENSTLKQDELIKKAYLTEEIYIKNLNQLKNKGIISCSNQKYKINDPMLKTWLKHQKQKNNYYPL